MKKNIVRLVVALAVLASATMFMGCLSFDYTYSPTERAVTVAPSIEGTWYSSSNGSYYDISANTASCATVQRIFPTT